MVELQILSKVLATKDYSIIENNYITEEYYKGTGYEDEYDFIKTHYEKYGTVPDKETFLAKFTEYKSSGLPEVYESDEYLVDAIREEYLFKKCAPILEKSAKLASEDANAGVAYLLKEIKNLAPDYRIGGFDIIAFARKRLEDYNDKVENQDKYYFSSGFVEVDSITHGIKRIGELIVLYARTNHGKSWVLLAILTHIWKMGFRVGLIEPEMEDDDIGYRFDTLYKHFSNKDLTWGKTDIDLAEYEEHIAELEQIKTPFIVSTPEHFDHKITVSKLRNYIKQYKLDVLAIDGITYLTDERARRNDNRSTELTHISEDLKLLSLEMKVPILVVHQANRSGVIDKDTEGTPGLETLRDSDGIAHNATKMWSLRHKDDALDICIPKNREGATEKHFKYLWNVNIGEFIYTENVENTPKEEIAERRAKKKASGKDVF